ncbi:MAG: hypothetical protein E7222_14990 [Clostridiales bacterium]|nr:hypothetical protein [Clostridiales bacterium]
MLVIVDGPPGATGKNARYPAVPITMKYFSATSIDFILDDYNRNDEKEIAKIWSVSCCMAGISHTKSEIKFEKGGVILE